MKQLLIGVLILLAGCAAAPTMDELKAEALKTGDWTEVEKREQLQAKRMGRTQNECPQGYALLCESNSDLGNEDCRCVGREAHGALFNESINKQPPNPRRIE